MSPNTAYKEFTNILTQTTEKDGEKSDYDAILQVSEKV